MMLDKLKVFLANYKTTVPGILALLCGLDSEFFKFMPPEWEEHATRICLILVAMGVIAAKDADKTGAGKPVEHKP